MLKDVQSSFINAIINGDNNECSNFIKPTNVANISRINIYKNNVVSTLRENIIAKYPIILALVGEEFLNYCVREYVKNNPSKNGNLDFYGKEFANFIASFKPAQTLPYLSDVAKLEWLLHEIYFDEDIKILDKIKFSKTDVNQLENVKFKVNKAVKLIASKYPIYQIYQMVNDNLIKDLDISSGGENLLIIRPEFKIKAIEIYDSEYQFLSALFNSKTLHEAYLQAERIDNDFDVGRALQKFISLEIFCDFYCG